MNGRISAPLRTNISGTHNPAWLTQAKVAGWVWAAVLLATLVVFAATGAEVALGALYMVVLTGAIFGLPTIIIWHQSGPAMQQAQVLRAKDDWIWGQIRTHYGLTREDFQEAGEDLGLAEASEAAEDVALGVELYYGQPDAHPGGFVVAIADGVGGFTLRIMDETKELVELPLRTQQEPVAA